MKYTLILFFTSCVFSVQAQQAENAPFKFNKRYYELEDNWVVFPVKSSAYRPPPKYEYGFVYFDVKTGYTLNAEGRFGLDKLGHMYRDPGDYYKNGPYEHHLTQVTLKTSVIPDSILAELKVKKAPDWIIAYHKANPDKRTVDMKLRVGKLDIYARDAAKYMGEYATVRGAIYKYEVVPNKTNADSVFIAAYMAALKPADDFVIVTKASVSNDANLIKGAKAFKNQDRKLVKPWADEDAHIGAQGRIVIFEKQPAIIISRSDLMIFEPVD